MMVVTIYLTLIEGKQAQDSRGQQDSSCSSGKLFLLQLLRMAPHKLGISHVGDINLFTPQLLPDIM